MSNPGIEPSQISDKGQDEIQTTPPGTPRETRRIVKIAPGKNAMFWQDCLANGYICVGWDAVGDLRKFESFDAFQKRFNETFANRYGKAKLTIKAKEVWTLMELEPGDIVVANQGISRILAVGEVVKPGYEWRPERVDYCHTVRVRWNTSHAKKMALPKNWRFVTVDQVGPELYQQIISGQSVPHVEQEPAAEKFLAETYLTSETLDELTALLEEKQQIILYGPPGTGKTYIAQKFARYFVGGDEDRVQIIQFHPSYSYDEFMEGIRPEARDDGPPRYPVRPGHFRDLCEKARGQDGRFVMIVDEINRGNIAKIFGELMFLLEYRDREVPLVYSGIPFSIPDNVYLIGTMNTADRSIALVDFALRRRFHFVHFGADRGVLARWIEANGAPVPYLLDLFDAVNGAIDDRDYQIGFSYFMKPGLTEADLRRVWRYSIEPYLEEYFFDNRAKVEELRWDALVSRLQGDKRWISSAYQSINSWPVNPFPDRLPRSFATALTSM